MRWQLQGPVLQATRHDHPRAQGGQCSGGHRVHEDAVLLQHLQHRLLVRPLRQQLVPQVIHHGQLQNAVQVQMPQLRTEVRLPLEIIGAAVLLDPVALLFAVWVEVVAGDGLDGLEQVGRPQHHHCESQANRTDVLQEWEGILSFF